MQESDRGIRRQAMQVLGALLLGLAELVVGKPALALPTSFQSQEGIDPGYSWLPQVFVDVNNDRQADFCRFVGDPHRPFIACLLSGLNGFRSDQFEFRSIELDDLGYDWGPRAFADVNGDGRADFCRLVGDPHEPFIGCMLAGGNGFSSNPYGFKSKRFTDLAGLGIDTWPRAFVDITGDRKADFCRFVDDPSTPKITCMVATGDGFSPAEWESSAWLKAGLPDLPRGFVDADGDGLADFCQFIPNESAGNPADVQCVILGDEDRDFSNPSGWGGSYFEVGHSNLPRTLADVDGDGAADFCRSTGDLNNLKIFCSSFRSRASRVEYHSEQGIFGGAQGLPVAFADVDGDEQADFCRFTGERRIDCALADPQTNLVILLRHGKVCAAEGDASTRILAPNATYPIISALLKHYGTWFKCGSGTPATFYFPQAAGGRFKQTADAIKGLWSTCLSASDDGPFPEVADTGNPTDEEIEALDRLLSAALDAEGDDRILVTVFVVSNAILVEWMLSRGLYAGDSDSNYKRYRVFRSGAHHKRMVQFTQEIDSAWISCPALRGGLADP